MANWNMYTPWPFSDLFEELGDKVEVRDYSRYNFTTPIMKPDNMEREQVLKQVLRCYGRFYSRKTFFSYPFIRDKFKRKYMFGCLKAFAKMTATKRFYDLGRVKMNGSVDLRFDDSKVFTKAELVQIKKDRPDLAPDTNFGGAMTRRARKAPNNTGGCEAKPAEGAAAAPAPAPVMKI
jgi:anaerobic magnesium-protoporphyrin IX monomethyl ester cyclase